MYIKLLKTSLGMSIVISAVCALVLAVFVSITTSVWWGVGVGVITIWVSVLAGASVVKNFKNEYEIEMKSKELFAIVKNLPVGVIVYDNTFHVRTINPAAQEIFKISQEEIYMRQLDASLVSDPKLKTLIQVIFSSLAPAVVKRSEPGKYPEIADISFEEPKLDVRMITDRIFNNENQIIGFVKLISNRTREADLLKSKSEFITVAAHQLRTPLTAINWGLEALEGIVTAPEEKELLDTSYAAAKNALNTVNNLLDASKMEEGKFGYQFQEIQLIPFINNLLVQVDSIAKQFSVKLFFDHPKEENIVVHIDTQKMGMALYNFLDNAIKYNVENGEIAVSVVHHQAEQEVAVIIRDTGIGIPQTELPKLFTKFFRAENAVKTVSDGTGLGLYLAKNIIERHGGTVGVSSEVNRGTIFTITLPLDQTKIPQYTVLGLD